MTEQLFRSLGAGDELLFGDRREPLTVEQIEWYADARQYGKVTVVAEAVLNGPRGGCVSLELCRTGRVRAVVGRQSFAPAYTVRDLRVVNRARC